MSKRSGASIATTSETSTSASSPDWRNHESVDDKLRLIKIGSWGTEVEGYLWYDLGFTSITLSRSDRKRLIGELLPEGMKSADDIQLVRNDGSRGGNLLLRVRGKLTVHPAVMVQDTYCALYQFGGSEILKDPSQKPRGVVNFAALWD